MLKKGLLALVLTMGLVAPGCLGPNKAFNGLNNWNAQVSEHDWVNEVIFIGFIIVPVYELAYIGDVLIFNTMDYWGKNPIGDPGSFPESFGKEKKEEESK